MTPEPTSGPDASNALEQAIAELEGEMGDLQMRHRDLFSFANAWAERHDAIMELTPPQLREQTQARLRRIAIRWGLADGVRMTAQFPALRGV